MIVILLEKFVAKAIRKKTGERKVKIESIRTAIMHWHCFRPMLIVLAVKNKKGGKRKERYAICKKCGYCYSLDEMNYELIKRLFIKKI